MDNLTTTLTVVGGLLLTGLLVYMFYTTEIRKDKADIKVKKDVEGMKNKLKDILKGFHNDYTRHDEDMAYDSAIEAIEKVFIERKLKTNIKVEKFINSLEALKEDGLLEIFIEHSKKEINTLKEFIK